MLSADGNAARAGNVRRASHVLFCIIFFEKRNLSNGIAGSYGKMRVNYRFG